MSFLKRFFGKGKEEEPKEQRQGQPDVQLKWVEPSENPWGLRLVDLRPITLG